MKYKNNRRDKMSEWKEIASQLYSDNIDLRNALSQLHGAANQAIKDAKVALWRMDCLAKSLETFGGAYKKGKEMFDQKVKE